MGERCTQKCFARKVGEGVSSWGEGVTPSLSGRDAGSESGGATYAWVCVCVCVIIFTLMEG